MNNIEITMSCRDGQLRPGYGNCESEITMSCRDGQLRPGYGNCESEITMSCRDGQLRPGYGQKLTPKKYTKKIKKVA